MQSKIIINIRCGFVFCELDCNLQLKLNQKAEYDKSSDNWFKVCFNCYSQIFGNVFDSQGSSRELTKYFFKVRRDNVDKVHLEVNKLNNRLNKVNTKYLFNSFVNCI